MVSVEICSKCGTFFNSGTKCVCGNTPFRPSTEQTFSVSVSLTVLECDRCGRAMSIGHMLCPDCGEEVAESDLRDPRLGPLNAEKLRVGSELLARLQGLLPSLQNHQTPRAPITDDQFLKYIDETEIIGESTIRDLKATLAKIDFTSITAIQSVETSAALIELNRHAEAVYETYVELASLEVKGALTEAHSALCSIYWLLLELHIVSFGALMVLTMEEIPSLQRRIQSGLDAATEFGLSISGSIERLDIESVGTDMVNKRLSAFLGAAGSYEHNGQADFAATLVAAMHGKQEFGELLNESVALLGPILRFDPAVLPPNQSAALFAVAAETAAADDPISLRRRAGLLLDLYSEALAIDHDAMVLALADSQYDVQQAIGNLLALQDRLTLRNSVELPADAFRQELTSVYGTLSEWVYRRLLTLPLVARTIVTQASKTYSQVESMGLGAKLNELSQVSDSRYAQTLLGADSICRNANAHGGVETNGERILLKQRDRVGRETERSLSDDELIALIGDLSKTCRALLLAHSILQIQLFRELPTEFASMHRRVAIEAAQAVVGLFGLSQANVMPHEDSVAIVATEDINSKGIDDSKLRVAAYVLSLLFPEKAWLQLSAELLGGEEKRLHVSIPDILTQQRSVGMSKTYRLLYVNFLTSYYSDEPSRSSSFVEHFVRPAARITMLDVQKLIFAVDVQIEGLTLSNSIEELITSIETQIECIRESAIINSASGPGASFIAGLTALKLGIVEHHRRRVSAGACLDRRPNKQLERGMKILRQWTR